jgi:hypothetical protein
MSKRRLKNAGFYLLMLVFLLSNLMIGITVNPAKTQAAEINNAYEAEAPGNSLQNGAGIGDCESCSGGKKVNNLGNGAVIFNHVNVPTSGTYKMNVYYIVGDNARSFYYTVNNNGDVVNLTTPSTGSWSTVGSVTTNVALAAGDNTIKFDKAGGYAPDLDRITVSIEPVSDSGGNPSEPVVYPNSHFVNIINGNVKIEYDLNNGVANYYANGVKKIANFYASVQLENYITSKDYTTRTVSTSGNETTITLEGSGLPTMKQHFYMVNADYFDTLVEVSGANLSTNRIAPIVVDPTGNVDIGQYSNVRALWVPYDNDAWVSYNAMSINNTATSNEVTAFYDNTSRNGLVIGSVVHDTWKTGITYNGVGNKLINLNVFGGNTNIDATRDVMPHGKVTGNAIKSPKVFVGYFMDWRNGMETYANENTAHAPKFIWNGGVPFGWNSWGGLGTKLSYTKATAAANFIKKGLMNKNFSNNDTAYINLDSYWTNFTDAQLSNFVSTVHNNGQKAGIYWGPFVYWGSDLNSQVEGTNYKYSDIVMRKSDGTPISLGGAFALDPTHPGTIEMNNLKFAYMKSKGFEYIKLDFLTHGSLEGGSNDGVHYDPSVQTGIQAYNKAMQTIKDQINGSMFISLSIAPLFPYQYGQARRIATDTYGKVSETQYTLNSVSYGWWMNEKLYNYNDPDGMVLYKSYSGTIYSDSDNKTRVNGAAITGTVFLNNDDLSDVIAQNRASAYLTNPNINNLAKRGKSFRPVEGNTGVGAADTFTLDDSGEHYIAVFNYDTNLSAAKTVDLSRAGLKGNTNYSVTDLWTNATTSATGSLSFTLNPGESTIVKLDETSENTALSGITMDGMALKGFAVDATNYTIVLPYGTTKEPKIKATTVNKRAKAKETKAKSLPGTATIDVTSESGKTTKTYSIHFAVVPEARIEASLADLTVNGETITGFSGAIENYDIELPFGTTIVPKVAATVKAENQAKAVVTPAVSLPGTTSVVVTALDGVTTKTYTIHFTVSQNIPQSQLTAIATSAQETWTPASNAIDGDPGTLWHTSWSPYDNMPQSITLKLGGSYNISSLKYIPRSDGPNGIITDYNIYVSNDGLNFTLVAHGNWDNNALPKTAAFTPLTAQYVKLEALAGVNGYASAAEINVGVGQ